MARTVNLSTGFSPKEASQLMSRASNKAGELYSKADAILFHVDACTRLLARFNGGNPAELPDLVQACRNLSAALDECEAV